jgi:hypothetical protein
MNVIPKPRRTKRIDLYIYFLLLHTLLFIKINSKLTIARMHIILTEVSKNHLYYQDIFQVLL